MNVQKKEDLNTPDTNHTNPIFKKERRDLGRARDENGQTREQWIGEGHNYANRKWVKTCITQTQENKKMY